MTSTEGHSRATASPTEPRVTFYWRSGCAFCVVLRHKLTRAGVVLDERNIWADPDAAAFVRSVASGFETVPTVVVAGTAMVNPRAQVVLRRLGLEPERAATPRAWLARLLGRRPG